MHILVDGSKIYEAKKLSITGEIVCVKTEEDILENGLLSLNEPGIDWSEYVHFFKFDDRRVFFSKDEAMLKKKVEKELALVPLKKQIDKDLLNQRKEDLINLSKDMLSEFLSSHPLISNAYMGQEGVYSITKDKQNQMHDTYSRYQSMKTVNPNTKLHWNETGKVSKEWKEEDFLLLMSEVDEYVRPYVIRQQELELEIKDAKNFDLLESIIISY